MAYPRTKARKALGALLEGIPGIKRVYLTRRWPREPARLPCLCVYLPTEDLSFVPGTGRAGNRMVERLGTGRVVAIYPDTGVPDEETEDALDATLAEIERRIAANPNLRDEAGIPLLSNLAPTRLDTGFDGTGSAGCVIGALTLSLTTHHREGRTETTLPASHHARGETP